MSSLMLHFEKDVDGVLDDGVTVFEADDSGITSNKDNVIAGVVDFINDSGTAFVFADVDDGDSSGWGDGSCCRFW